MTQSPHAGTAGSHPASAAPAAFHLLAKPTGAICNLDCTYCFFLSKEALYPGDSFRMGEDVLEAYLRQLLAAHQGPEVVVAWQGGEPTLMGVDFFRRAMRLVRRYQRPGQRVVHTIQTNGTLLDEQWARFLAEHRFLVGISLDGPRAIHDAYRVNKAGRGSFDEVLRGYTLLREHGVEVNILCTVHAANAEAPLELYRFLRDTLQARYLQFIPVVERVTAAELPLADAGWGHRRGADRPLYTQTGDQVTARSVTAEQYGRFLVAVFEEWLRHDVGTVFVQMFDAALAAQFDLHSLCIFAPTCGDALALEHNGDLYSCDHYVEPDHLLGNIGTDRMLELVASPRQRAFGEHKRDSLPAYCRGCEVRYACNGGCPRERFISAPDGEAGLNYLCAGYRHFFTHTAEAMRRMAELIRHGRQPREIAAWVAAQDARRGRNTPCPCGSGGKWKHCHGRTGGATGPATAGSRGAGAP